MTDKKESYDEKCEREKLDLERTFVATMAMMGILANGNHHFEARDSVEFADSLIKELKKPKQEEKDWTQETG